MNGLRGVVYGILALLMTAPCAIQGQAYDLQSLGALGRYHGQPLIINPEGMVAGSRTTGSGAWQAFIWTADQGMKDLQGFGGQGRYSFVSALNETGQVAGTAETSNGCFHGFLWSAQAGMRDLGTLGGLHSYAKALNNEGEVVGQSEDAKGRSHGFFWSERLGMKRLGTSDSVFAIPWAINDAGEITGITYSAAGRQQAFYASGTGRALPICPAGVQSLGVALNASGTVLGWYRMPDMLCRAFAWKNGAGIQELARGDAGFAMPKAINSQGQVVGQIEFRPEAYRACLWSRSGELVLLPEIEGMDSSMAVAINDQGTVIGSVKFNEGHTRAFVWHPEIGMELLPLTGDASISVAAAINSQGTIVGCVGDQQQSQLCLWQRRWSEHVSLGFRSDLPDHAPGSACQHGRLGAR